MNPISTDLPVHPLSSGLTNACEVTLVFCDIAGLTAFTERRGDFESYRIVKACQALVTKLTLGSGGDLLEVRGDGFLMAFEAPAAAGRCAVEIQRAIAADPELPIHVRIGMHTGEAIHDVAGYYGGTVIAAFRVSSLAHADEILISDATRAKLAEPLPFPLDRPREVRLKGFTRRFRVWTLQWSDARDATRSQVWSNGHVLRIARVGSSGLESGAAGG